MNLGYRKKVAFSCWFYVVGKWKKRVLLHKKNGGGKGFMRVLYYWSCEWISGSRGFMLYCLVFLFFTFVGLYGLKKFWMVLWQLKRHDDLILASGKDFLYSITAPPKWRSSFYTYSHTWMDTFVYLPTQKVTSAVISSTQKTLRNPLTKYLTSVSHYTV